MQKEKRKRNKNKKEAGVVLKACDSGTQRLRQEDALSSRPAWTLSQEEGEKRNY